MIFFGVERVLTCMSRKNVYWKEVLVVQASKLKYCNHIGINLQTKDILNKKSNRKLEAIAVWAKRSIAKMSIAKDVYAESQLSEVLKC